MTTDDLLQAYARYCRTRRLHEVKMFGGIGFMLNGNMIAAASRRGLLVRVGKDRQRDALARPGARPMEMRGRVMEGYVYVDPDTLSETRSPWLQLALDFVQSLPPKNPDGKQSGRKENGNDAVLPRYSCLCRANVRARLCLASDPLRAHTTRRLRSIGATSSFRLAFSRC